MKIHFEKIILDGQTGCKVIVTEDLDLSSLAEIDAAQKNFLNSIPDVSSINISKQ